MLSLADEDSQVIIPDPLLTELIISSRGIQLVHLQGVSQKASNMKIDQPSFFVIENKTHAMSPPPTLYKQKIQKHGEAFIYGA